jgi:large subunit ribosomal protein L23
MIDYTRILVRPIVTERSYSLLEQQKYTFEVDKRSTKEAIAKAVELAFNVTVLGVNTSNRKGKFKRQGKTSGYTKNWKKAIVTLKEGDRIEIFEGA